MALLYSAATAVPPRESTLGGMPNLSFNDHGNQKCDAVPC